MTYISFFNNISVDWGGGGVSRLLTLANKGEEGSEVAEIRLTLLMDSPFHREKKSTPTPSHPTVWQRFDTAPTDSGIPYIPYHS